MDAPLDDFFEKVLMGLKFSRRCMGQCRVTIKSYAQSMCDETTIYVVDNEVAKTKYSTESDYEPNEGDDVHYHGQKAIDYIEKIVDHISKEFPDAFTRFEQVFKAMAPDQKSVIIHQLLEGSPLGGSGYESLDSNCGAKMLPVAEQVVRRTMGERHVTDLSLADQLKACVHQFRDNQVEQVINSMFVNITRDTESLCPGDVIFPLSDADRKQFIDVLNQTIFNTYIF